MTITLLSGTAVVQQATEVDARVIHKVELTSSVRLESISSSQRLTLVVSSLYLIFKLIVVLNTSTSCTYPS
jgi:hypothetical protein